MQYHRGCLVQHKPTSKMASKELVPVQYNNGTELSCIQSKVNNMLWCFVSVSAVESVFIMHYDV